jgi:hypothetical protein
VQVVARDLGEEVQPIPVPVEEPVPFAPPPLVEEAVQVVPSPPPAVVVLPQPTVEAEEVQIPVPEQVETPRVMFFLL